MSRVELSKSAIPSGNLPRQRARVNATLEHCIARIINRVQEFPIEFSQQPSSIERACMRVILPITNRIRIKLPIMDTICNARV